jgi:hypothetical protein
LLGQARVLYYKHVAIVIYDHKGILQIAAYFAIVIYASISVNLALAIGVIYFHDWFVVKATV